MPNVLKIDEEGAEIAVMAGGVKFTDYCRPALIVEMSEEERLHRAVHFCPSTALRIWARITGC
jgi:hypothetical protein